MKKENLCRGKLKYPIFEKAKRGVEDINSMAAALGIRPSKVKRIRLQCPICGRKVWSSVNQDDGEIYHTLPPHKPKGWWKKKKDTSKHKERNIR